MSFRAIIVILPIAAMFLSCNNAELQDKQFEEQAIKDIQLLNTSNLQFLERWDYTQRGKGSFWSKFSGDTLFYNCSFFPSVDTPKLTVYQIENFLQDFKAYLKVDTMYEKVAFTKMNDTTLKLTGTNKYGQDVLLATNLSFKVTFPEGNPFDTLSKLTALKDRLNVIGISHEDKLGGFIQFYFPDGQHILAYLPDTLLHSNTLNESWRTEFLKGKRLKPNWNYRKLNGHLDGG